jgi:peptidoglycan/xylan/chitin deacetylase (PgdA/CDA1 family)
MLAYLAKRKIAVFSSDFGADDWKGISAAEVERRALKQGASSRGGVVILHETRVHTVQALDAIITEFERRGYRFVQIVPKPGAREWAAAAPDPLIAPVKKAKR